MTTATDPAAAARPADAHARRDVPGADAAPGPRPPTGDAIGELVDQAKAAVGFYVQTRIDQVRATATTVALKAMVLVALAVVGLAVLAAGAFFLVAGAVQALAAALETPGVAALSVGGGLLALFAGAVWFVAWKSRRGLRRRLLAKYQEHHARQRVEVGADVAQMAGRPQESLAAGADARGAGR